MQKKKAISLIVLVITIIVMIVLAGAIILSLNNSGIIGKANQAVKFTDEATVKELAQMAWAEAYADGVRSVEDTKINGKDVEGFKKRVEKALEDNDINKDGNIQYFLNVTDKGVTVKPIEEAWVLNQKELKVKRGTEELTIGQEVKYESGVEGYTDEKGWKVLGADEDGNLLIVSATDVKKKHRLGYETTDIELKDKRDECQNDWLKGAAELDQICENYGNGEGAINGRSITVEDVNKVTGYVVESSGYGNKTVYKYGNEVTYTYNGTTSPAYMGTNNIKGIIGTPHTSGFYWYDKNDFKNVEVSELTNTANDGKKITTLTSNAYFYFGKSLTESSTGTNGLPIDSDAYKMLFGTSDSWNYYWLASPYIHTQSDSVYFGLRIIFEGKVYTHYLWKSDGDVAYPNSGVRAVVTISSDVNYENLVK